MNRQQPNPNIQLPKGAMELELDGGQAIAMALRLRIQYGIKNSVHLISWVHLSKIASGAALTLQRFCRKEACSKSERKATSLSGIWGSLTPVLSPAMARDRRHRAGSAHTHPHAVPATASQGADAGDFSSS